MAEVEVIYNGDNVEVNVSECACSEGITDYNDLSVYAVGDGVTITGDGTTGNPFVAVGGGGGGAVDSVNSQTGVVVLDADDISDTTTVHKFVTATDLTKLSNLSGTNTGDVSVTDSSEIDFTLTGQNITASLKSSSIDETKLDTSVNASLDLADSALQSGDNISELVNNSGYITSSALTGLVPYTGASGDVDLGTHGLEATKVRANDSGGLIVESNNGTDVGVLGVGNTANVEWYGSHNFSGATQDTIAAFTGSGKTLNSLALATYPSLTELSYVKGVTSAIQTQIGNKQDTLVSGTNIKTINGTSVLGSGDIVISGGGSLSALTAATGSNTINNANNSQVWQWNSLTGTGLKLSNSFTGTQTGSILCEIENTGTLGASQNTTALKVTNTKSSSGGTSTGIDISVGGGSANGINIANSSSLGAGIDLVAGMAGGGIQMNSNTLWFNSNTQGIKRDGNYFWLAGGTQRVAAESTHPTTFVVTNSVNSGGNLFTFMKPSGSISAFGFGTLMNSAGTYLSEGTSNNTIRSSGGSMTFTGNTGLAGGFSSFSPTDIMTVYGTNSNVGIGTTTPTNVALLELTSTTKGFLPPRMTATQASAITAVDGLMLYVTDTNGTFTSIGFWGYQNGSWQKM